MIIKSQYYNENNVSEDKNNVSEDENNVSEDENNVSEDKNNVSEDKNNVSEDKNNTQKPKQEFRKNEPIEVNIGYVVNCFSLTVREKPNTESKSIGFLKKGTTVVIDNSFVNEKFYKIKDVYNLKCEGYCIKKFISFNK